MGESGDGTSAISMDCCAEDHDELASAYKALSHPARLTILRALAKQEERCCGDICTTLPLAQSTVSQHLKVLREAGFIELEPAGMRSHYRLNREKFGWLLEAGKNFADQLSN